MNKIVGILDKKVITLLKLPYLEEMPIYISTGNIEHIKNKHFEDSKYILKIEEIIKNPTYIAKNPKQNSIEYIKEYRDKYDRLILVAVRALKGDKLFVRTLFTMSERKKNIYLKRGYAKKMH